MKVINEAIKYYMNDMFFWKFAGVIMAAFLAGFMIAGIAFNKRCRWWRKQVGEIHDALQFCHDFIRVNEEFCKGKMIAAIAICRKALELKDKP